MSTRTTPATERAVMERDSYSCVVCGWPVSGARGYHWSVHHRQPRGMGGSTLPHISAASNLVVVCGHGTFGCHGRIERHREQSYELGYLVQRLAMPAEQPILIKGPQHPYGSLFYLTDDGRYSDDAPAKEVGA
ncbi:MAG: HNH endonuclease [Stackebrandtia sp.]